MSEYGLWQSSFELDGERFRADCIEDDYAARAGFERIYAVDGLPLRFKAALVRAAQVVDVPHTWRVEECKSEGEVTDEILKRGIAALDADIRERRVRVITYLGEERDSGDFVFLAAGAIRDKLAKGFHNEEFPVVSRAIVVPAHRGKGLGSLIVEHRMNAVLRYYPTPPKAIHMGTMSDKILHSVGKFEQQHGVRFTHIGDEQYEAHDGVHSVHAYLCFLPTYREKLDEACLTLRGISSNPALADRFREQLRLFIEHGVSKVSGSELERLFHELRETVDAGTAQGEAKRASALLEEMFLIKRTIGAEDPE